MHRKVIRLVIAVKFDRDKLVCVYFLYIFIAHGSQSMGIQCARPVVCAVFTRKFNRAEITRAARGARTRLDGPLSAGS